MFIKSVKVEIKSVYKFSERNEKGEVISLEVKGEKKVIVTGHNVMDVFSKKTMYWRAEEFRAVISEWEGKGYEVELVTCVPVSLPEDLKGYVMKEMREVENEIGVEVDKSIKMVGQDEVVNIHKGEVVKEEWWKEAQEKKKENMKKVEEEYGDVVQEWWLDIEECKIKEEWYKDKCYKKLVYMREYEWVGGWKKEGQDIIRRLNYGEELWVLQDAPVFGFMKAEYIP